MFTVYYYDGWFHISYPVPIGVGTCLEAICEDSEVQAQRDIMIVEGFNKKMKAAICRIIPGELMA